MKMILKAWWPTIYRHGWLGLAMVSLMFTTVVAKVAYPYFLRDLLNSLQSDSNEGVIRAFWCIVGTYVFANAAWFLCNPVIVLFQNRTMRDLDQRNFAVIQRQSMRFFENSFTGSLITTARRFRTAFNDITNDLVESLGRSMAMIVLTLVVFVFEYPWLALAFAVWIVIYCGFSIWFAKISMNRDLAVAKKDSGVGGAFADSISNQRTVKSFGKERDEQKRFNLVTEDCYQHRKDVGLFRTVLVRIQMIITALFEVLVIFILIRGWRNGTVTSADFIFFQSYILLLMQLLWDFGSVMRSVFRSLAEAQEMAEIYAQKPEVKDAAGARLLSVDEGEIEFHAVNFNYINRETRQHHDVNNFTLKISPGQLIALVGHSGAGKSTLVKLLLRYFDINSGYIRIDRQDIANVTQLSLRQQIAVVPEEPELFHRTLYDNVAFARPDASEAEVITAIKRAHAWKFIQNLPEQDNKKGLDIVVGERGVKLSGGERQRIALARAFLADAPILILDEATSALDSRTEYQIQSAIADLLEGRTCIVIAHRLSTIQRADRIIVMESGSIAEEGTHQDLLDQNGVYADLWAHQSGGYLKE